MPTPSININHRGTLTLLRGLVPHRTVSQREALQVAELQASRLRQHLGIDEARFPTEALDLPRIRIEYDADLPSSGMAFWNGSTWVIVLNATEAPTRQRFSLVHEFKHIVDHTTQDRLYGADARRNDPAAEQAADYFAACVLMPKLYVKRHWGQGPRTPTSMAKMFGVSPAAMKYRLDQLGVLDEPERCRCSRHAYRRVLPRTLELAT
ncbi:MAG: ImmA/IrrE family metallo-endopeptidase [Acidimicrobiales bacterium]